MSAERWVPGSAGLLTAERKISWLKRTNIKYGRGVSKVFASASRGPLSVLGCPCFARQAYLRQLIDDTAGVTLGAASSQKLSVDGDKTATSLEVGKAIAAAKDGDHEGRL